MAAENSNASAAPAVGTTTTVAPPADVSAPALAAAPASTTEVVAAPAPAAAEPAKTEPVTEPAAEPAKTDAAAEPAKAEAADAAEKPAEQAPDAAKVEPEKGAAPVYEDFKLPEGAKIDAPVMSAYKNILGKYNLPQEAGQELADFHLTQLSAAQKAMEKQQADVFDNTRRGWVKDIDKAFGNRRDTVLNDAKWAVAQFGGDKKQVAELWQVLAFTGAGDHPAVVRTFANIARKFRERGAAPTVPTTNATTQSPADRRYGGKRA